MIRWGVSIRWSGVRRPRECLRDLPAVEIFGMGDPRQLSASGRFARATLGVVGSPEETFTLFHLNICKQLRDGRIQ